MHTRPGKNYPLGATYDGHGTNFALFSSVATGVDLCLFDSAGHETRIPLTQKDADVWHIWVEGLLPGQRYGYRVYGPFDPEHGVRCNSSKLLLDPYAKAISRQLHNDESLYSYRFDNPNATTLTNTIDDAASMPKSVVTNPYFDWEGDRHPNIPMSETIIYETHVRGITALNPNVPSDMRGTYAGMAYPSVIDHLKSLGVTSVELMPVHHFLQDPSLQEKGLANYWGYNTIGFFAPNAAYSSSGDRGEQVGEFKQMVRVYHEAGLEIILDVVYNHTAEGNHLGPTLSFRGIDNAAYYRLVPDDQVHYFDTTGTGNSLNMNSPRTLQLVVDSLRYWAQEMHVDGFRFDLAATLGRGTTGAFDRNSTFFSLVQADPVLARTKLIAEPWDTGSDGYQVGGFPNTWSEWNGRYRDTTRDFWRSQTSTLPVFASSITGSSDIYQGSGRKPAASVNFVTAHDGFTLRDLVSYNNKHNEANSENNNDGTNDNRSWNCGVEGATDVQDVEDLRWRQMRNFVATLMVSQGTPMLVGGDEIGRTQQGNNNAYCQDNAISWYDWNLSPQQKRFEKFVRKMVHLRRDHPVFRRETYFEGRERGDTSKTIPQIEWFDHTGTIMDRADWDHFYALSLMVFLNGHDIPELDQRGVAKQDSDFLLIFNAFYEPIAFTLPSSAYSSKWRTVIDTFDSDGPTLAYGAGFTLTAQPYSFLLLEGNAATVPEQGNEFPTPNSLS